MSVLIGNQIRADTDGTEVMSVLIRAAADTDRAEAMSVLNQIRADTDRAEELKLIRADTERAEELKLMRKLELKLKELVRLMRAETEKKTEAGEHERAETGGLKELKLVRKLKLKLKELLKLMRAETKRKAAAGETERTGAHRAGLNSELTKEMKLMKTRELKLEGLKLEKELELVKQLKRAVLGMTEGQSKPSVENGTAPSEEARSRSVQESTPNSQTVAKEEIERNSEDPDQKEGDSPLENFDSGSVRAFGLLMLGLPSAPYVLNLLSLMEGGAKHVCELVREERARIQQERAGQGRSSRVKECDGIGNSSALVRLPGRGNSKKAIIFTDHEGIKNTPDVELRQRLQAAKRHYKAKYRQKYKTSLTRGHW